MATVKKNRFDFAKPEVNENQGQLANLDTLAQTPSVPTEEPKQEIVMATRTHKGEKIGKGNTISLTVKPNKNEWQEWTAFFNGEMRSLNKGIINAVNEYIKARKSGKI